MKHVLRDGTHERPPVFKDHISLVEGPTLQCNWTCYQRPPVLRHHIFIVEGQSFTTRSTVLLLQTISDEAEMISTEMCCSERKRNDTLLREIQTPHYVSYTVYTDILCLYVVQWTDHCYERPPVLKDHILVAEGPTFQCNWTCHQRPPVLRDHIFMANWAVFQDRFYCTCHPLSHQ